MRKKVLIAVGDKNYSEILQQAFSKHPDDFDLSNQEVMSRRFLVEIVDIEKPDILIIHDTYLGSDYTSPIDKDKEILEIIRQFRVNYNDALRIVYLCERPVGDRLLASLASIGVMDIINSRAYDIVEFIDQLKDIPRFQRVEKFLPIASLDLEPAKKPSESVDYAKLFEIDADDDDDRYYEEDVEAKRDTPRKKEKPTKVIEKKVVEKKVVQKVVNKNVIKRDYKIQILNQTEKVVGVPVRKKLVMIGSPVSRSGSTFIAHLLARSLSQMNISTTYVENPFSYPYTYDRFNGSQFSDVYRSKFYQYSKYIDPKLKSIYDWKKNEVDLICKHPNNEPIYQPEDVSFETFIKVLYSLPSTVTILDVGTDWQLEIFQDAFDLADHVYIVIEPDISLMQYLEEGKAEHITFIHQLLENDKACFIGNRFHESIMKNQVVKDLYKTKMKTMFPVFPVQDVFQVQFDGVFLNDYKDYPKKIDPYVQPLLADILPHEFMKKQKKAKGSGLFKNLFASKKITVEKNEKVVKEEAKNNESIQEHVEKGEPEVHGTVG